jgi:hypothetical protein
MIERQVQHKAGSEHNHCVLMYHTETPLQCGCGKMMHVHKNHTQVCCTFTTINIRTGMWLAACTGEWGTICYRMHTSQCCRANDVACGIDTALEY